jgi:antitoxin (DNA-binding transcriptional repressor) of toxin-antitoxin stability system
MQVNMHEAKSQLSRLGEKVWKGESVVIARSGKPWLDLVPHVASSQPRVAGRLKGKIRINSDFEGDADTISAWFEGKE